MIEDDKQAADEAVAKELDGVPADMIDPETSGAENAEAEDGLSDALKR